MVNRSSIIVASLLLAACGGDGDGGGFSDGTGGVVGGGGDSGFTPSFTGNGIYVNSSDLVVMVVDSERLENNLALGDFEYNAVYFVDSATTTANQMITTGLTYADNMTFITDPSLKMTADFANDSVTLSTIIDGTNIAYSMDKTGDSQALSSLVGTHTNPDDGSTWTINADGSFIVNGICTITGRLERNGAYYNVTKANATACALSSTDGEYSGVFLTVDYGGSTYIAGLLGNESALLWGSAPKS